MLVQKMTHLVQPKAEPPILHFLKACCDAAVAARVSFWLALLPTRCKLEIINKNLDWFTFSHQ